MTKYIDFINSNLKDIVDLVNKNLDDSKKELEELVISKIKECLDSVPTHYKWQPNDCPWDHSGELVKDGQVNLNQSIYDFLNDEYTGNSRATYISGMGLFYDTYGDEISYDIMNFTYGKMLSTIKEYIKNNLNSELTDKQFDDIQFNCNEFDDIYDSSITYLFFNWEYAVEFLDIGQVLLTDILRDEDLGR